MSGNRFRRAVDFVDSRSHILRAATGTVLLAAVASASVFVYYYREPPDSCATVRDMIAYTGDTAFALSSRFDDERNLPDLRDYKAWADRMRDYAARAKLEHPNLASDADALVTASGAIAALFDDFQRGDDTDQSWKAYGDRGTEFDVAIDDFKNACPEKSSGL